MLLPLFMVLNKSITVPLLQMAKDNWMDARRKLRSPGCCQVTFNPEQICRMCHAAITCLPQVLGTDCKDKVLFEWLLLGNTLLWRGIFVAGGNGLLARRCAEKAPRYSRQWRLARWEWNLFIFKRCQVHRRSELGQAQVSTGHTQEQKLIISYGCGEAVSTISGHLILSA